MLLLLLFTKKKKADDAYLCLSLDSNYLQQSERIGGVFNEGKILKGRIKSLSALSVHILDTLCACSVKNLPRCSVPCFPAKRSAFKLNIEQAPSFGIN